MAVERSTGSEGTDGHLRPERAATARAASAQDAALAAAEGIAAQAAAEIASEAASTAAAAVAAATAAAAKAATRAERTAQAATDIAAQAAVDLAAEAAATAEAMVVAATAAAAKAADVASRRTTEASAAGAASDLATVAAATAQAMVVAATAAAAKAVVQAKQTALAAAEAAANAAADFAAEAAATADAMIATATAAAAATMAAAATATEAEAADRAQRAANAPMTAHRDRAGDARDDAGDERDDAAGRRDRAGELRDDAGAVRDSVAERRDTAAYRRDQAGDSRDRAGDVRDHAGHDRDDIADGRDLAADYRDLAADLRDVQAQRRELAAIESILPMVGDAREVLIRGAVVDREQAASDRAHAASDRRAAAIHRGKGEADRSISLADRSTSLEDRAAGAGERSRGEAERSMSLADRGAGADERSHAQLDRGTAMTDRDASARERERDSRDPLAGLARRLSSASTADEVCRLIVELATHIVDASVATVGVLDADSAVLNIVSSVALDAPVEFELTTTPLQRRTPLTDAIRTQSPVHVPNWASRVECYPDLVAALTAAGVVSSYSEPMFRSDGSILGALGFGWSTEKSPDSAEQALIDTLVSLFAQTLERAQITDLRIELITGLQHQLLGDVPALDGMDAAVRYVPANIGLGLGGDWYEVIALNDERVFVVIGDVAGHGVEATARMALIQGVLHALIRLDVELGSIFGFVEETLAHLNDGYLATADMFVIEHNVQLIHHVSAGHPPPVLWVPGSGARTLDGGRRPLLGSPKGSGPVETVAFPPGSVLVAYTDGLIEKPTESIDVGIERLKQCINRCSGDAANTIADKILAEHLGDATRRDDTALAVVAHRPR